MANLKLSNKQILQKARIKALKNGWKGDLEMWEDGEI